MTYLTAKFKNDSIHPETRFEYTVTDVEYQRNGSSGEGFYHLTFHRPMRENEGSKTTPAGSIIGIENLQAIVFDQAPHRGFCAVFDPNRRSHHYRGDNFEAGLRKVIKRYLARPSGLTPGGSCRG